MSLPLQLATLSKRVTNSEPSLIIELLLTIGTQPEEIAGEIP
ncbi:MAG: hypothetical protein R6W06_03635 [Prochlorococcaceae cyanobacterium]